LDVDLFNLLCLPAVTSFNPNDALAVLSTAVSFCKRQRAFLIIDCPDSWQTLDDALDNLSDFDSLRSENAAMYFPRVQMPDPLDANRLRPFPPCGIVAGVYARTDSQRGVWKAPAGQEASLTGVRALVYKLNDRENGMLNPLGLNCLRVFPVVGPIVWGARTLLGADVLASEWKYIPVRRLALFIEESLYRGTQWVVFEPNDEPLWAQIRLNVGAFMHNLFRQGAFQGRTPREAFFVKCDKETTIQNDIDLGIVNILVGFAPLKPAEFVIIKISQIAGQVQA
jgi:phage tail sheath protein FI